MVSHTPTAAIRKCTWRGARRGLYLDCNYGHDWSLDRISVGPGGLRGRRAAVEYMLGGDPHEAPIQCLVPLDAGCAAIEFYLKTGGLPLTLEWASPAGLHRRFLKGR